MCDTTFTQVGAVAVGASLVSVGTAGKLVALTGRSVHRKIRQDLEAVGFMIVTAKEHESSSRLGIAISNALRLSAFDRVVIVEIYSIALENVDELFSCPAVTCAVHDQSTDGPFAAPVVIQPGAVIGSQLSKLGSCDYFDPLEKVSAAPRCARLPTRYAAFALWLGLNASPKNPTSLVRVANEPPPEWAELRRARLVHLALGPMRPWHWWASLPFADRWRTARDMGLAVAAKQSITSFETRVFDIIELGLATVLPWLLALIIAVQRRKFTQMRTSWRSPPRCYAAHLVVGHLTLFLSLAIALFVSNGSTTYHGFLRPSRQLLYRRAPAAPAIVFYSNVAALAFAAFSLFAHPSISCNFFFTRLLTPAIILPALLHAYTSSSGSVCNLANTALPLTLAFVALPVAATFSLLALADAHLALSVNGRHSKAAPSYFAS